MSDAQPTLLQLLTSCQSMYSHTPAEWLAEYGHLLVAAVCRERPSEVIASISDDQLIDELLSRDTGEDGDDLIADVLDAMTPKAHADEVAKRPEVIALLLVSLPDDRVFGESTRRGVLPLEQPDNNPNTEADVP